jgi:predicted Zn-dependent peptidase
MLFLLGSLSFAQTAQADDISSQAASVTEFDVNGLKVIFKRRNVPTVAAGLFIRGGARNLTDKTAGIESVMLNAAIEAGRKYPRQAVRRELSSLGGGITASAGQDFSVVSLVSTRQNFDKMWDVFADVTINPAFAPEDVQRTKQIIISGLREKETNPDDALEALQSRTIFAGHPYANETNGTIATVGAFTPEELAAYHRGVMQTSRLLLVVVGNLDADDLKARVAASFGKLPRGDYKEQAYPAVDFSKPTLDVVSRALPTNYVEGVFNAPSLNSPDYYAMRVATSILQQLVYNEVRVRRQLSYAPNAELNNDAANTANIYVSAVDANQAVSVMLNQIDQLKNQPVDDDKIAGMTGEFLTTYYLRQETNAAQAADLARYELIGGGWRNSFQFIDRIREVKPADVQAAARKYMKNIRFVVIGNPAAINRSVFTQG